MVRKISVPTLIIHGQYDNLVPLQEARVYSRTWEQTRNNWSLSPTPTIITSCLSDLPITLMLSKTLLKNDEPFQLVFRQPGEYLASAPLPSTNRLENMPIGAAVALPNSFN